MCAKVSYPTGAKARAAASNIRRFGARAENDRKPVRVYHCSFCNKFHLTGDPQ